MDNRNENFELHEKIATFAEVELVEGRRSSGGMAMS